MSRTVVLAIALLLVVLGAAAVLTLGGGEGGPATAGRAAAGTDDLSAPAERVSPLSPSRDPDRTELRDPGLSALAAELPGGTGIVGLVRSASGEAAPRAAVWLLRADRDERIGSTTADEHARFALALGFEDDLGQAGFRVAAHQPDHGLAAPVAVARPPVGETVRVDLVLDVAGLSIGGVVRGPAGDPMPDYPLALVRVDETPESGPEWLAGRNQAEVRTGADGRFVARGLRVGGWMVDCYPPRSLVGVENDDEPPSVLLTRTGVSDLDIRLPFVRVEFTVVDDGGRPRAVEHIALRAYSGAVADEAAVRFSNGEGLDDLRPRPGRDRVEDVDRITVFAGPGSFLVASAAHRGVLAEAGHRVTDSPAAQTARVLLGDPRATTTVRLRVLRPDRSVPELVVFRARRQDGLLVAPSDLDDLGAGWRRLPDDGQLALPPGPLRIELLGDPFDAGRAWFPTASLPAEFDWDIPPPPAAPERTIRLQPGAWVDVEVAQDPGPPTATARAAWIDERLSNDVRVVKGYASIEPERGAETALRLAWIAPDGSWHAVRGVPHRPGETVTLRALGVFEPGEARFAIQTWRPATVEDSAGWALLLQPGRNVLRLRLDADAVLHRPGG